jgi:dCMP deaminase
MISSVIKMTKINSDIFKWMQNFPLSTDKRPNWDEYFLLLAFMASRRASCYRRKIGAVIVIDKAVISTGYNGAPNYQPNCLDIGECYRNKHNIKSLTQLELCRGSGSHAESNAIALAAQHGHATKNSTMYICGHQEVCNFCRGIITNARIIKVVHLRDDGIIKEYDVETDWNSFNA